MKSKQPNKPRDLTYLPCTMDQWECLVNDMTERVNKVTAPHCLDANYVAQVLMGAIHAYDHKTGLVSKTDLFESCVNRISCHVTFAAVEALQTKLKQEANQKGEDSDLTVVDDVTDAEEIHHDA